MEGQNAIADAFRTLNESGPGQVGVVLLIAFLSITLSQRFLPRLADRFSGRYRQGILASVPVIRLLVIIAAIALSVPRMIEPTFENLVALLGALGLALGFALKDYVSSLIAGVVTLYEMFYRPGDWIEIDGAYGEVKSISMRTVKIVTPDDTVVVIPHLKVWDKLVFNANDGSQNLLCVANFYLYPRHDAGAVKKALYDVALTSVLLQIQRPINVMVLEKPWGTQYRLKAYPINPRDQFHFVTDLTVRGKAALMKLGVEFVSAPVTTEEAT